MPTTLADQCVGPSTVSHDRAGTNRITGRNIGPDRVARNRIRWRLRRRRIAGRRLGRRRFARRRQIGTAGVGYAWVRHRRHLRIVGLL